MAAALRVAPSGGGRGAPGTVPVTLATAWLSLVGGLLFWANAPILLGWQPRLVLSGSMQPGLAPGDVVLVSDVVEPRALLPGQVVLVDDPDLASGSYLHRVLRLEPGGRLVTKGDANRDEDHPPVTPDRVLGQMRAVVPSAGLPLVWVRQGEWLPLGLVGLATVGSLTAITSTAGRRGRGSRIP